MQKTASALFFTLKARLCSKYKDNKEGFAFMNMLVCTDGSEASNQAIQKALKVAEAFQNVDVSIIYVYDASPVYVYKVEGGSMSPELEAQLKTSKEEEGKKILEEAASQFEEKNITPTKILKEGHPSSTIVKVASENHFDLVVLGNRGLSGFKKFLLGSVSNAVAQEIKSDVLIIKAPE